MRRCFGALVEERVVISFIEKTWFMWWILMVLVVLRWFQLFSVDVDETAFEVPISSEGGARMASDQMTSASVGRLSV